MKVSQCDRCGTTISVSKANEVEDIKCPHCNKEFTVDKKTRRWAFFVVFIMVFFVAFLVSTISQLLNLSIFLLLIPSLIIGLYAYRWSLFILAKMNKVSYMEK